MFRARNNKEWVGESVPLRSCLEPACQGQVGVALGGNQVLGPEFEVHCTCVLL